MRLQLSRIFFNLTLVAFIASFPQKTWATSHSFVEKLTQYNCENLITNNYARNAEFEKKFLYALDLSKDGAHTREQITSVSLLSKKVYLAKLKNDVQLVVRFYGEHSDTVFEVFANSLFLAQSGLITPLVRPLGHQETEALKLALRKVATDSKILKEISSPMIGEMPHYEATLAVFYEAQPGSEYLKINYGNDLRWKLINLIYIENEPSKKAKNIEERKAAFEKDWNNATPLARESFINDFKKTFPEAKDAPNIPRYITSNLNKLSLSQAKVFNNLLWYQLPENVRRQLAEQWMMRATLGIPDFHYDNWLIYHDHVIGIDLADLMPDDLLSEDAGLERFDRNAFPLGDEPHTSSAQIQMMFKALEPGFFSELAQKLTPANIKKAAKDAEMPITKKKIKNIQENLRILRENWATTAKQ